MTKEEFKKIRVYKRMYQRELAEYLGVATVTARFYESGARPVSSPISKLMRALKKEIKIN